MAATFFFNVLWPILFFAAGEVVVAALFHRLFGEVGTVFQCPKNHKIANLLDNESRLWLISGTHTSF
jgi:hypothetical protein